MQQHYGSSRVNLLSFSLGVLGISAYGGLIRALPKRAIEPTALPRNITLTASVMPADKRFSGPNSIQDNTLENATTPSRIAIRGGFPKAWINGLRPDEPIIQIHRYCKGTWILRQNVQTHFEAPFLYLLKGANRALLIDTGATAESPVRAAVDKLIGPKFPLLIAHSHAHSDHTAGDAQFSDRPETVIIGHSVNDVVSFFSMDNWPLRQSVLQLGNRDIDVIPIPGHEKAHIAFYDRISCLLLTGDTLYAGRLYINDFEVYKESIRRLAAFASYRKVAWILGNHIEMTNRPGVDYKYRATTHPSEHTLQLEFKHLVELDEALRTFNPDQKQKREIHSDFVIVGP